MLLQKALAYARCAAVGGRGGCAVGVCAALLCTLTVDGGGAQC